ncbi:piercer of microtubule wall 1 protein isoform X1 [Nematostella vectensis]|uniref:piercer of microtubule wall 1 protein isoform X1 n=1 Tax=Nematostella vectensis TaxID=45351 RepID=UPI0020776CAD|nr:piercer of microtubule wall 1 protein isoform X1 [Nematostella vectensis]
MNNSNVANASSSQHSLEDDFEKTKAGKEEILAINNPGNPVFSCPARAEFGGPTAKSLNQDCFDGYNTSQPNPMYMTSSQEYGNRRPTVHTMPTSFHAKCQKFTDHLGKCGMYRNHSLNTASDKSIV